MGEPDRLPARPLCGPFHEHARAGVCEHRRRSLQEEAGLPRLGSGRVSVGSRRRREEADPEGRRPSRQRAPSVGLTHRTGRARAGAGQRRGRPRRLHRRRVGQPGRVRRRRASPVEPEPGPVDAEQPGRGLRFRKAQPGVCGAPARAHVPDREGLRRSSGAPLRHHHERSRRRAGARRHRSDSRGRVDAPGRHAFGQHRHALRERPGGRHARRHDVGSVRPRRYKRQLARAAPVPTAGRVVFERGARRVPDPQPCSGRRRDRGARERGRRLGRGRRRGLVPVRRDRRPDGRGLFGQGPQRRHHRADGRPPASRVPVGVSRDTVHPARGVLHVREHPGDLGALLHAPQDHGGPHRRPRAHRQRPGHGGPHRHRRLGARSAGAVESGAAHADVGHLHRGRIRRREREPGNAAHPDRRAEVPGRRPSLRQLRRAEADDRRRRHPRWAPRQPAHPPVHGLPAGERGGRRR